MNGLPPEIKHQLLSLTRQEPSLTRGRALARQWRWLAVGSLVLAAGSLIRGIPATSEDRPGVSLAVVASAAFALALLATTLVLAPWRRPRSILRGTVLAVPLLLLAAGLTASSVAPDARPMGWPLHSMCLSLFAVLGGLLLAIGLLGIRPLDPIAPTTTGAALGAAVGAWVTLAVSLQCPSAESTHVLVGHVTPVLAVAAVGAALGARTLARRGRARP